MRHSASRIIVARSAVVSAGHVGIARLSGPAVAGEDDPTRGHPAASSRAPGAPAVVSATSTLSKTKGRSIAWCAFTRPPWAVLGQSSEYMKTGARAPRGVALG